MRIISFIYKKTVIKGKASVRDFEVLTHLNIFEEKKNQRAPPTVNPDYTEPVIVPFDDGWPGYDEMVSEIEN